MKKNKLAIESDRPIAFFDIEATGISPRADRIIELAVVKIHPDGTTEDFTWRINPEMPIPHESTLIHGITDADIAECPTFRQLADEINSALKDCDLAGYNNLRFDIPMLVEEFLKAQIYFDLENRRVIDVQRIFHKREPRTLSAALSFYCGEMHLDAHGAMPDVLATIRVLQGQYERYQDLPKSIDEIDEYCNPRDPAWADRQGRLRWTSGELAINFGKKKGVLIKTIMQEDPGFLQWILRNDFPSDTKKILQDAINGVWPTPSAEAISTKTESTSED